MRHETVFVTSESSHKEAIPERQKVEYVVGKSLPGLISPAVRRKRVDGWLAAADFQLYDRIVGDAVGTPHDEIDRGFQFGSLGG